MSDELVHVLDGAFLPGGVGVGEVNRGAQGLRNPLMAGELAPVVGGDCVHLFAVREEEFHHLVGHPLGVLAPGQAGQEQEGMALFWPLPIIRSISQSPNR